MSFSQEYQRDVDATKINLQYGVPGQQAGWSAMAKVVRDFDEEKVRDCKEDIDTLLVFVSLLIFSYQFLMSSLCVRERRPVYSLQFYPRSLWLHTPIFNPPPRTL